MKGHRHCCVCGVSHRMVTRLADALATMTALVVGSNFRPRSGEGGRFTPRNGCSMYGQSPVSEMMLSSPLSSVLLLVSHRRIFEPSPGLGFTAIMRTGTGWLSDQRRTCR